MSGGRVGGVSFPRFCLITTKIWSDGWTSDVALRWASYSCVTAQFYLESEGKYILEAWGHADPKDVKRREAPSPILAPPFTFFVLLTLGMPYVNWAGQECCLFYLRSSFRSLDLPLFYFYMLVPSLSFSNRHSGLLFPILTT